MEHQDLSSTASKTTTVFAPKTARGPFFTPVAVQAKRRISTPGDPWEQQAEQMADRVTGLTASPVRAAGFFQPSAHLQQQQCASCGADAKKRIRRKASFEAAPVTHPALDRYVDGLQGKGSTLSGTHRQFFESRMDYDFGDVRIHTGPEAARSAASLQALAYTTGNHIVFNKGQYDPGTSGGRHLLAHELTHVIQQHGEGKNRVDRDLAKALPDPMAQAAPLTEAQIAEAIRFNEQTLRDPWEISLVRDLLGINPEPARTDADFSGALAEYQAQNGLNADGKLGAVTASRLSAEIRAEGKRLSPRQKRNLSRSSRRMGTRAMSIHINHPAVTRGTRGSALFGVRWEVPDTRANGFIIQHLHVERIILDCGGHAALSRNFAGEADYWETWQVINGRVMTGITGTAASALWADDTFGTTSENPGTRGLLTMTGHVSFFPDYTLNAAWALNAGTPAGVLPHRATVPPEWDEGDTLVHQMTVVYDSCAHPPTADVTTIPR